MPTYSAVPTIGAFPAGNTFLNGDMDELAIYSHALTAVEVADHHDFGVNGPR
jgi:hypothetical protein